MPYNIQHAAMTLSIYLTQKELFENYCDVNAFWILNRLKWGRGQGRKMLRKFNNLSFLSASILLMKILNFLYLEIRELNQPWPKSTAMQKINGREWNEMMIKFCSAPWKWNKYVTLFDGNVVWMMKINEIFIELKNWCLYEYVFGACAHKFFIDELSYFSVYKMLMMFLWVPGVILEVNVWILDGMRNCFNFWGTCLV